jgi:hypothetical protein
MHSLEDKKLVAGRLMILGLGARNLAQSMGTAIDQCTKLADKEEIKTAGKNLHNDAEEFKDKIVKMAIEIHAAKVLP